MDDTEGQDSRFGTVADRLAALEQLPTMVELFLGPDHVTAALNPLVVEYFSGFNPLGYKLREFLDGTDDQGMVEIYDRALAGETVRTEGMRFELVTPNGQQREIFVEFVIAPFRDSDGTIVGAIELPPAGGTRGLRGWLCLLVTVVGLPFGGRDVAEAGVEASGVVSVDPGEDGPAGFGPGPEPVAVDELSFQR